MIDTRLAEVLRALVDGWCERRALKPLAVLLPAYVGFVGRTDEWVDLWRAINDLRGLSPDELTDTERAAVAEARAIVYQSFKALGRTAELQLPAG